MSPAKLPAPVLGMICAAAAILCFSFNDMAIKFLSGGYALHQVVLIRSSIALVFFFAVILPLAGGLQILRTRHPVMHAIRGVCVVATNMFFFLGVAALPLADAVAITFISPLLITVFSVIFLGEHVGPRRWAAIAIGLIGVLIVLRPGTSAFQPAALLPLISAFAYTTMHMFTRRLGASDSAVSMTFYLQLTFVLVSGSIGLAVGDGRFAGSDSASLEFFFRAWIWPEPLDWLLLAVIGLLSLSGGFFISQAYRLSEAALVAPFEYIAMPLAVFWGALVFGEWPDLAAWVGILLIIGSGLFMIWREARTGRAPGPQRPRMRR
ncbi:DMT family transporter [Pseudoruegeria sp. HB172150]|uniref:DMT family transporter n=1 Tax=Pseudoruegeria sp. HB172150 TaxID=2721164 RepID=UPI001556ADC3|nr:DMT family transporter [Pseudoruegeria sp. HB172150]